MNALILTVLGVALLALLAKAEPIAEVNLRPTPTAKGDTQCHIARFVFTAEARERPDGSKFRVVSCGASIEDLRPTEAAALGLEPVQVVDKETGIPTWVPQTKFTMTVGVGVEEADYLAMKTDSARLDTFQTALKVQTLEALSKKFADGGYHFVARY